MTKELKNEIIEIFQGLNQKDLYTSFCKFRDKIEKAYSEEQTKYYEEKTIYEKVKVRYDKLSKRLQKKNSTMDKIDLETFRYLYCDCNNKLEEITNNLEIFRSILCNINSVLASLKSFYFMIQDYNSYGDTAEEDKAFGVICLSDLIVTEKEHISRLCKQAKEAKEAEKNNKIKKEYKPLILSCDEDDEDDEPLILDDEDN